MDLSSIGTSIGQYIRQGIDFILNVNNLPITIGMVLIFCIVMFVMKGTKHIIDRSIAAEAAAPSFYSNRGNVRC